MIENLALRPDTTFIQSVEARSGEKVSRCFHCRKCTNGCPMAFAMDVLPNQVMRMIQLGIQEELLKSKTLWICASCQACTTRCPNDIDIAHVMDSLRQWSHEKGLVSEKNVAKFHEAVLDSIYRHGRLFELGMIGRYKLATRDPFGDAKLGWEMFKKGKLRFWPARIRGKEEIRAMFNKGRKD
jgi:heterodisulfide reductase subunit C